MHPLSSAQWQLLVVATAAAACTLTSAALYAAIVGLPKSHRHQQPQPQPQPPKEPPPVVARPSRSLQVENKTITKTTMATQEPVVYLNNPNACFDYVVGDNDRDEFDDVKVVAKAICPTWKHAKDDEINVKIVSGGITNRLFRLTWQDNESVLVRIYGDNTEAFIDRKVENMLFALLAKQGFAPAYHGRFTNGRIEGWMDARPLEPEEMGLTSPVNFLHLVGKELGLMHKIQVPLDPSKPVLWAKIDQFEHLASEIKFPTEAAKLTQLVNLDLPRVRADLQWLKSVLPSSLNNDGNDLLAQLRADGADEITTLANAFANDVVFCHNDALSGNILFSDKWQSPQRVQIIDYEYGGYNFRGFDFANHFCEHCGFEMDLALYPSADQQFVFFRSYMEQAAPDLLKSLDDQKQAKAFFYALYPVVNKYALASHLFWGFWAVVQAAHSKIDFDFLDYANKRFTTFQYHRAFFFPPQ